MAHDETDLIYHLTQREDAAIERGNASEAEHIERHASEVAERLRRHLRVCTVDSSGEPVRCWIMFDARGVRIETPHDLDAEDVKMLHEKGRSLRVHDERDEVVPVSEIDRRVHLAMVYEDDLQEHDLGDDGDAALNALVYGYEHPE